MSDGRRSVIANVTGVVIVVVVYEDVVANAREFFSSSRNVIDGDVEPVVDDSVVKQNYEKNFVSFL